MKAALNELPLPKYIAIEGPIGVGKTTLANKIAKTFNYDAFLEQPAENPFLKNFYRNPEQSALATQLFFLFQMYCFNMFLKVGFFTMTCVA